MMIRHYAASVAIATSYADADDIITLPRCRYAIDEAMLR